MPLKWDLLINKIGAEKNVEMTRVPLGPRTAKEALVIGGFNPSLPIQKL